MFWGVLRFSNVLGVHLFVARVFGVLRVFKIFFMLDGVGTHTYRTLRQRVDIQARPRHPKLFSVRVSNV